MAAGYFIVAASLAVCFSLAVFFITVAARAPKLHWIPRLPQEVRCFFRKPQVGHCHPAAPGSDCAPCNTAGVGLTTQVLHASL